MSRSVGCKFLDISWLKALLLLMSRKVHIDSNTHPLTRSQVYPPSNKCHTNIRTQTLRVRYQVNKTPENHANTFYDTLWHCDYAPKKKSPAAQDSGGSARLLHWSNCLNIFHNHFLKNLYWTCSQLVKTYSLYIMISSLILSGTGSNPLRNYELTFASVSQSKTKINHYRDKPRPLRAAGSIRLPHLFFEKC